MRTSPEHGFLCSGEDLNLESSLVQISLTASVMPKDFDDGLSNYVSL